MTSDDDPLGGARFQWLPLKTGPGHPGPRSRHVQFFDPHLGGTVLWGGLRWQDRAYPSGGRLLAGGQWHPLPPGREPSSRHRSAAFDASRPPGRRREPRHPRPRADAMPSDGFWNFRGPGRIVFGWGLASRLAEALGATSPLTMLLVSDSPLVEVGAVDRVAEGLRAAGHRVTVFDGGEPEPRAELAVEAAETARAVGAEVFVGLGGGSNLDLAKIVSVLVRHGGTPEDYFGFDRVPGPVLPMIAVPTTAGTGSEVSHSAVLTAAGAAGRTGLKVSTLSEHLRPALALVDPGLTVTCPPKVTAESGADALVHAIEALTCTAAADLGASRLGELPYQGKNPLADGLAREAIAAIGRSLRRAVAEPTDRAARTAMALAATQAGLAFSNAGVALVHALEYPLGGAGYCGHGLGNALLLPAVMRFLLPARAAEYAEVGRLLRGGPAGNPADDDPAAGAAAAVAEVVALLAEIGIPARLRQLGVPRDVLPEMARQAVAIERLIRLTPRPVTAEDALAIYEDAW